MLTISSVGVSPWPQQTPAAKVQPVTTAKTSNVVSRENAESTVAAVPSGDGNRVQAVNVPSSLPPVDPAREAVQADRSASVPLSLPNPAQSSASQIAAQPAASQALQAAVVKERYRGELPPEMKNPAEVALDEQIDNFIPNLWQASRAAVDVLIGEEALAAAQRANDMARAMPSEPPAPSSEAVADAAQSYVEQAPGRAGVAPGAVVNTQA